MNLQFLKRTIISKKILFVILIFLNTTCLFSQYSANTSNIPNSPSTSQLEKILNTEVNGFKGTLDLKIPLYDIVFDEVTIPIYLQYDSSGIQVEELSGFVGQSWSLISGGLISRNQVGTPDDIKKNVGYADTVINTPNPMYGVPGQPATLTQYCVVPRVYDNAGWMYGNDMIEAIIYGHETGLPLHPIFQQFNDGLNYGACDFAPDYFNLFLPNKKSENFFFGRINGKVNFIENDTPTKVNWTIENDNKGIKKFFVTDGNGTQYKFNNVEYLRFQKDDVISTTVLGNPIKAYTSPVRSTPGPLPTGYNFWNAYTSAMCSGTVTETALLLMKGLWPKAWHLSEIETLKKRKILLDYEDEVTFSLSNTSISRSLYGDSGFKASNKLEKIILPKLKRITWAEGSVDFIFNNLREDVYTNAAINVASTAKSLDKIKVYDKNNKLIKEIDFTYSYKISEGFDSNKPIHEHSLYKRLFLDKVSVKIPNSNGVESEYKFEYNSIVLPNKFSFEQDYWGYYNKNNATGFLPNLWWYKDEQRDYTDKGLFSLYPRPSFIGEEKRLKDQLDPNNTSTILFLSDRRPNQSFSKAGLLEKVIYPTGGVFTVEYGQNKFLYRGVAVDGPGVRVQKTTLSKEYNDPLPLITNYKYEENGVTSGRIRELPAFTGLGRYQSRPATGQIYYISSSPLNGFNATFNREFGYEKIEKQFLNGSNGKEVTEFSFPVKLAQTQLDSNGSTLFSTALNGMKTYCNYVSLMGDGPDWGSNRHDYFPYPNETALNFAYGKVLKHSIFNSNGDKKYEKINDYAFGSNNIVTKAFYVQPGEGYSVTRYLSSSYSLKKSEEFFIENNNTLQLKKEFDYDLTGLLLEEKVTNSGGDVFRTKYDYPNSGMFQLNLPIKDLNALNAVNNPIVISNFKNNELLSKVYNEYESVNNSLLDKPVTLKRVYQLEVNKPITDFQDFNWSNAQLPNFNLIDSRMKVNTEIHKNDTNSNILEFSEKDGAHICYIWGYNKTKIIAKIENINYVSIPPATIADLQALSDVDNDNCNTSVCKEEQLRVVLNALRNVLPDDTMITTYTYDPLVGVTSITNPRGESVYYVYDKFQRLKQVKDKDGNILSENEYHYKN